ncbi:MAG TPA: heparan-alpha-glucosaminide N-acetyltransferase domain-containing protein [Candidatus Acidoferrales bacterium]|nr:heparan-alpha-glucosaminide N-acetyltransferase domain-containing protein [Candidatus Acidoferrales bacterium]
MNKPRLTHIDWMRGLACLLMFQTHCYDSWLGGSGRHTRFFGWSQLVGTLPAPLFLFLAGISVGLGIDRHLRRGTPPGQAALQTMQRGAEILGLGLLFRVQEFVLGLPSAPWTDLLRVDILNAIGLSISLMGLVYAAARTPRRTIAAAAASAAAISLLTPLVWTSWRPRWLPWFVESYVNGVHTFGTPQHWLFPVFPWTAFAFAGLVFGLVIVGRAAREHPGWTHLALGLTGAGLFVLGLKLDGLPMKVYPVYDFWHTSPNFFLARLGVLLLILSFTYAWCRWGAGERGFSPLIQMGTTSLIVYWVHIEFVYGRFSILPKRGSSIAAASLGLASIFVAMLLVSIARTRMKGRGVHVGAWMAKFARQPGAASG